MEKVTQRSREQAPAAGWFSRLSESSKAALAVFRLRALRLPPGVPDSIFLGLTGRCGLACLHCKFSGERPGPDMPFRTACRLLAEAAGLGVPKVIFFGGEPLLYPRLRELVARAARLGFFTELDTNGQALTPALARRLAGAGLCSAMVSLHSAEAGEHDRLAGPGAFRKASAALSASLAAGLITHVSACVFAGKKGPEGVRPLLAFARRAGAHGVRLVPYSPPGGGSRLPASLAASLPARSADSYARTCFRPGAARCDGQAGRLIYVGPSGDIRTCPYAAAARGRYPAMSLTAALKASAAERARRQPCQTAA